MNFSMLAYFQILYMEMCQHGKTTGVYTKFLNIVKNWSNLAPVLIIWRKKVVAKGKNVPALTL